MNGAFNITNSADMKNEHKMEIEDSFESNHQDMVFNYILSKRLNNPFYSKDKTYKPKTKRSSLPLNLNEQNTDIIKNMEEVITLLNEFYIIKNKSTFNIKYGDLERIKILLHKNLKQIRKELSKETIPITKIKNILKNNIQDFIEKLILSLKDTNDEHIQSESLWIINNLIFFISKYDDIFFDQVKIANLLISYLLKIQNETSKKYFLLTKIYRIFANLINLNKQNIGLIINDQLLDSIINYLNNPVPSFRITCLWLLNKIIISLRQTYPTNYIKTLINKKAISNYNFVFSRIKKNINIDEISEFYWLITELAKDVPSILIQIFLTNSNDTYTFNNEDIISNEVSLKNFSFILDNSLTSKMSQVSFRLISDILVVCNQNVKNEYLLIKFIENFFEKKSIILYINDVLNSPKNKYDISLVRDVLILVFNLICLSPIKSSIFFKKGIVNLICDRDYNVNKDVMKLLYKIFYRILISSAYSFEPNDEKVIRSCLSYIKRIKDDEFTIIIFIDILYYYLKASKTTIDVQIEDELKVFRNDQNLNMEKYLYIFSKLANVVNMKSPLSRYMRNM